MAPLSHTGSDLLGRSGSWSSARSAGMRPRDLSSKGFRNTKKAMEDKRRAYTRSEEELDSIDQLEAWDEEPAFRCEGDEENMDLYPDDAYNSPPAMRSGVSLVPPAPPIRKPCYGHLKSVWPAHEHRPVGTFFTRDHFRQWNVDGIVDADGSFIPMNTPGKLKRSAPPLSISDNNATFKLARFEDSFENLEI